MNHPLLRVDGIRMSYGERKVLDISRIELNAGKSYVLTGDNGSGKSTLLRVLAGLENADVGDCNYLGKQINLTHYPRWLRHEVIYVHQHPYLFRGSIVANIVYGLKVRGQGASLRDPSVRDAIEWAGVGSLLDVPPQKLSGGEKQRVALARARVLHPRLFLLDEPTANLDFVARQQVIRLIHDLCEANCAIVVACHDKELIELPHMQRLHIENGRVEIQNAGNTGC